MVFIINKHNDLHILGHPSVVLVHGDDEQGVINSNSSTRVTSRKMSEKEPKKEFSKFGSFSDIFLSGFSGSVQRSRIGIGNRIGIVTAL